ncbi:MAG TPA: AAA family ATPase [Candidatus Binataceae bacterium]
MVQDSVTSERHVSGSVFVGREREMAELRAGFDEANSGRGRLFLLAGEPGIGKTRIADELAAHANAQGARVVWGRCWEGGGAPAYWPWIQVLRGCAGAEPARLIEAAGAGAHDLAHLVPELRPAIAALADAPGVQSLGAEQARFRLFESVTAAFCALAQAQPLMIVLDDLHDADEPSLQMLRFVARALRSARILIVGTYRDLEVRRSPPLTQLIGDVIREGYQMPLSGLTQDEVARLVGAEAGRAPNERLVSTLYQATAGNPLFVEGMVRLIVAEGKSDAIARPLSAALSIPDGVRGAIQQRLKSLSGAALGALSNAATLGNEFDLSIVARISAASEDQSLDLMDEAREAGIVVKVPAALGRYRFSHALIRDALYGDLAPSARIRMHAKIGEVLEEQYGSDPEAHLAELAYHFARAVQTGGADKAIDYAVRAGHAANSVLAYEDALLHWQTALDLMENSGAPAQRRAELLVELGDAATIADRPKGVEYLEAALRLYEGLGMMVNAAEVHTRLGSALSLISPVWNIPRALEHLRKAESVLRQGPESASLGYLYIGLAQVSEQIVDIAQGLDASRQAMEIGERLGEEAIWTEAAVQHATYLLRNGRLREAYELFDAAWEKADRLNVGFNAAWLGGYARMSLWDPLDAIRWYQRELAKPRMAQAPFVRDILLASLVLEKAFAGEMEFARAFVTDPVGGFLGGSLSWFAGDWERAEAVCVEGLEEAIRTGSRDEQFNYRWLLGRFMYGTERYERAQSMFEDAVAICPDGRHWLWEMLTRPDLAASYAATGDLERAEENLSRCREIMAAGEDWRGLAGNFARGVAAVAAAYGRRDETDREFERAIANFRKYQAVWEEAQTNIAWGRALAAFGDRDTAAEKLDTAAEMVRRLGAGPRWFRWIEESRGDARGQSARLTDRETSTSRATVVADAAESGRDAILRKEGEYWTVEWDGKVSRLKDIKGLSYLARLLRYPHQEVHALDLVASAEPLSTSGNLANPDDPGDPDDPQSMSEERASAEGLSRGGLGDAGEMIDAAAKADYRRQLVELREELVEAKARGEVARAERAENEIEALERELARALGLGGRDRRAASAAERARLNVTRSIKTAIERIGEQHAELGQILAHTIRTGTFCSYVADSRVPIDWKF